MPKQQPGIPVVKKIWRHPAYSQWRLNAAGNAQQFSASGKGKVKRRLFSSGKQSLPCNEPASGGATHKRGHY